MGIGKRNFTQNLRRFSGGDPEVNQALNNIVENLNAQNAGNEPAINETDAREEPQLYIATEDKGKYTSSGTTDNGVINIRPIDMAKYKQDGLNDDVMGDEFEALKFWDQEISEDDIGIGVNMGGGRIAFYAIKGGGVGTSDDPLYEYGVGCGVALDSETWKRGNPDSDNPNNPSTLAPVEGFKIDHVVRVCYNTTNGKLIYIYREFSYDNLGMLKAISAELETEVFTASACS